MEIQPLRLQLFHSRLVHEVLNNYLVLANLFYITYVSSGSGRLRCQLVTGLVPVHIRPISNSS